MARGYSHRFNGLIMARPYSEAMLSKATQQIYNATRYSWGGFMFLVRSELAARMEVYGFVLLMALYGVLRAPALHFAVGGVLFFLLLAVEALNTAIEVIIDRVSPEISPTGKRAKDLGSFAVMCLLFANGIHMCYVLGTVLSPKFGSVWLSAAIITFFTIVAVYTKLRPHAPRKDEG